MFSEGVVRCLHLCYQLNLTLVHLFGAYFLKSVIASIEFIYSMFYIFLLKNIPTCYTHTMWGSFQNNQH